MFLFSLAFVINFNPLLALRRRPCCIRQVYHCYSQSTIEVGFET